MTSKEVESLKPGDSVYYVDYLFQDVVERGVIEYEFVAGYGDCQIKCKNKEVVIAIIDKSKCFATIIEALAEAQKMFEKATTSRGNVESDEYFVKFAEKGMEKFWSRYSKREAIASRAWIVKVESESVEKQRIEELKAMERQRVQNASLYKISSTRKQRTTSDAKRTK